MPWSVEYRSNGTDIVRHTFEWTSDGSGDAVITTDYAVSGVITRVVFIPSSTAAPTADYDITLTDPHGVDVLAGLGANLSDTDTLSTCPGTPLTDGTTVSVVPMFVDGILTLTVSNAGDTKAGTVVVFVR
jgi:hypothetical protein